MEESRIQKIKAYGIMNVESVKDNNERRDKEKVSSRNR